MAQNKPKYRRRGRAEKTAEQPFYRKGMDAFLDFFRSRTPKQLILYAVALLLAAAAVAGFVYIMTPHPLKLSWTADGDLIDPENGVTYLLAPSVYEPVAVKVGAKYAKMPDGTILYRFGEKGREGLDPLKWLSQKYDGTASIWYASTEQLPTLAEFDPSGILVCMDTGVIVQQKNTIMAAGDVSAVVSAMLDGEKVNVPACEKIYRLRFVSDEYPGLYYCLSYLEGTGENYLYDRQLDKGVAVGSLLLHYIQRDDMNEDENSIGYTAVTDTAPVTAVPQTTPAAAEGTA